MGFGGFSWKRALGITKAKQKISRATGIPLTKGGRQRKLGAMLGGSILGGLLGPSQNQPQAISKAVEPQPCGNIEEPPKRGKIRYEDLAYSGAPLPFGFTAPPPKTGGLSGLLFKKDIAAKQARFEAELQGIVRRVSSLGKRMINAELPEYGPFNRGSDEKREMANGVIRNHLKALIAIKPGLSASGQVEAKNLIERTAAIKTLGEAIDNAGDRAMDILRLAKTCSCPEAEYLVLGLWGQNPYVKMVQEMAFPEEFE